MNGSKRAFVFAVATALGLGAAPLAASPIPPPPQLWVVGVETGAETRIAEGYALRDGFDWSPDGSRIVYVSGGGLYVAGPGGEDPRLVSGEGEGAAQPRWSPGGEWIAYAGDGGVVLVSPDTGERRGVLERGVVGLDWSPDGTRLSYVSSPPQPPDEPPGPGTVYVYELESDLESAVAPDRALYSFTKWSPDGERIAFQAWDWSLRVVAPDGSGEVNVSAGLGHVQGAAWSPDGGRIAFAAGDEVVVAARDGDDRRAITAGTTPDWSADGARIAFSRAGNIFTIAADGSGEVRLTDDHLRHDRDPSWSPAGDRVAFEGTPVQVLCPSFPHPVEADVVGTPEDDVLIGTRGRDVIAGLGGDDVLSGNGGEDLICGGDGNDRLLGGRGPDHLYGERGRDEVRGGRGHDRLDGGRGGDEIVGGRGRDTVTHVDAPGAVTVDLGRGVARGSGADGVRGVEDASGWTFDDVLIGDGGVNRLSGAFPKEVESGDDVLVGRRGADVLEGLDGADRLRGGRGHDRLRGGRGRDDLDGGRGNDWCWGGRGRDSLRRC